MPARLSVLLEPCIRRTWTVNDAESMIVALDAASLQPVRTFHHVAVPEAIFAQVEKPVSLLAGLESPTEDGLSAPPTLPVGASSGSPGTADEQDGR